MPKHWGTRTYERFGKIMPGYASGRHRAWEMAQFAEEKDEKISERLTGCGQWLEFRDYYTVEQLRLTGGAFCQIHQLCPLCAVRRAGRMLRAYVERVRAVVTAQPGYRVYLVTVTVQNGADLGERLEHVRASWQQLVRESRKWQQNRKAGHAAMSAPPALADVAGGVASVETKRGAGSGLWHPHVHALLISPEWISHADLERDWRRITGDSCVVDVRPLDCNQSLIAQEDLSFETFAGDFCEVFKYALKFSELSLADNWQAYLISRGQRLIDSFGNLRGVVVPEDLRDAALSPDLPYIEILWRFNHQRSAYVVERSEVKECAPPAPAPAWITDPDRQRMVSLAKRAGVFCVDKSC